MKKGIKDSLSHFHDISLVGYTQLVVANSELTEAKEVRSMAAEVEAGEGNSVLAALTEQLTYLMATWDTKNSSYDKEIEELQKNRGNGPGNQRPGNNNRNGAH